MSFVWIQLYIEGEDKPKGSAVKVKPLDVEDTWDIDAMKKAVKEVLTNQLSHVDPNELKVYANVDLNDLKNALKNATPLDPWDPVPGNTSGGAPLIVTAPPQQQQQLPQTQQRKQDQLNVSNDPYRELRSKATQWGTLTACSRLGKTFLDRAGLASYRNAASACLAEETSQTLGTIKELIQLQSNVAGDGIGCFATILASSGAGKSQLAVSASMDKTVQSVATVLYINVSESSSQAFYMPHEFLGRLILNALESFMTAMGTAASKSAATICSALEKDEDNLFCGFLYYLFFDEYPNVGKEPNDNETSWSALRAAIRHRKKPFLFFLDEVPPSKPPDNTRFNVVLFFRDFLRSLGICPILMSTHTGAENYVDSASRGDDVTWVKIITRLPAFESGNALHESHASVFVGTERPLVSTLVAKAFGEGKNLSEVVKVIRGHFQRTKPRAWTSSPALQLMQLFATKAIFGQNTYKNVHRIVGEHFGSLVLEDPKSLTAAEAIDFKAAAKMSFVNGELEPLLYLALVSWDDSCLVKGRAMFPLVNKNKEAISVMSAFKCSQSQFEPWICTKNDKVEHASGDLLEVLVHASLTLASLKTDCVADTFLGGVDLRNVLCYVSKLMRVGTFEGDCKLPQTLQDLKYKWPMVPALGGSNSRLSPRLCNVDGTMIGLLERPANRERTDGFIWKTNSKGEKIKCDIMIECKNRKTGLDMTQLNAIFERIPAWVKCALIFTTKLNGELYSGTTLGTFKKKMSKMQHKAFGRNEASIVIWNTELGNTELDKVAFFEYSLKDRKTKTPWSAEGETKLLVVIFLVDLVEVTSGLTIKEPSKKKRKMASRDDLLSLIPKMGDRGEDSGHSNANAGHSHQQDA